MRILFLGDIMGRSGREAVKKHLPTLKEKLKPDAIIINAENAAHGRGLTEKICKELFELGADCITTGNHVWDQNETMLYITREPRLLRPANFPEGTPGNGHVVVEARNGAKILVANYMARLFMDPMDDPFAQARELASRNPLGKTVHAIFVDFHGETTSEKMALAHMLDGQVTAVVGTHTHLPTADGQILVGGTAFQADAGMCGDYNSVIGMQKEVPITRFTKKVSSGPMQPADGEGTVCGCLIETDSNGLTKNYGQVIIGPRLTNRMPDF